MDNPNTNSANTNVNKTVEQKLTDLIIANNEPFKYYKDKQI